MKESCRHVAIVIVIENGADGYIQVLWENKTNSLKDTTASKGPPQLIKLVRLLGEG